jgi:hypothetical protein
VHQPLDEEQNREELPKDVEIRSLASVKSGSFNVGSLVLNGMNL